MAPITDALPDNAEWVYASTDMSVARVFAEAAPGRGRAKVLLIEPLGDVEVDDSTLSGAEMPAFRMGWARVLDVVWREGEN